MDSVDLLLQRRSDIIRLDRQRREITTKYNRILQAFGFEDIYVIPGAYYFFKNIQYFDVSCLNAFFWEGTFGYRVDISRGGRTEHHDINKCIDTDSFVSICDDMLEFFSDLAFVRTCNIKEQLSQYLSSTKYTVVNFVSSCSDNDSAWVHLCKDGFFFKYQIERINVKKDVLFALEIDDEEEDPIGEKFQRFLDSISERIEKYICKSFPNQYWKCCIDPSLYKIEISQNSIKHEIHIHSGDNLSTSYIEDEVKPLIAYILKNEDLFDVFQNNHFHLYMDPNDRTSFFAYKEWNTFKVKIDRSKSMEYRSLFDKISSSQWANDFDHMDGHSFEHFCAKILKTNSFESVFVTQGSRDQGVDIIAMRDDIKYGIQCKCYTSDISNKAVQEVYAGKTFYECHVGVVLTNQFFTKSAKELAKKNGVLLWDRNKLIELIRNSTF